MINLVTYRKEQSVKWHMQPQDAALIDMHLAGVQENMEKLTRWGIRLAVVMAEDVPIEKFPMMVYHPDGRQETVYSEKELDDLKPGWSSLPGGKPLKEDEMKLQPISEHQE